MMRFLEMDGGDGYTTMRMHLLPQNCTLKNGSSSKRYVHLPQFLKRGDIFVLLVSFRIKVGIYELLTKYQDKW